MTDIPDNAHVARQMYRDGATTAEIYVATGCSKFQLYLWLDGGDRVDGKPVLEPIDRRLARPRRAPARERANMAVRMMRVCNQQISEMEKRENPSPTQLEQDSRRAAMIMRTLDGLTSIDERNREMTRRKKVKPENEQPQPAQQPVPRNIDELRRSLARKLEAIIAEEEEPLPSDS